MAIIPRVLRALGVAAILSGTVACSVAPPGGGIHDPYEPVNRQVHAFNTGLDRAVARPAAQVVRAADPASFQWIVNFSDNASLPGMVLNATLQGDGEAAAVNAVRFLINTTLGFGGFIDWAGPMGYQERSTDFGQTLAVWGVPEGAYVELPLLGPSTERDAAGEVVDVLLDPLEYLGTRPQRRWSLPARVGEVVVERGMFSDTVDSLLYDSADSYAQARLAYLQNRRFELGEPPPPVVQGDAESEAYVDDLLEDFYR
ncbi:MlaA family lipoprotein [Histidinibacterium lentulum]|uniref:VacJ family lipoprotein n=1 Tax=Histidinibacterium lentulum TaxID=2480588 RepID=A0A3N2R0M2_9RHOB|nr:VacJ family lipoprotein [Histidinibacterium lentulum]ROU01021.1 VacJ family lipoprotein [Histidinibacterium lentulum]